MKKMLASFGWKAWVGIALLIATCVMTVVALVTGLGEALQYITFISHLALILTALDMIWTARVAETTDDEE